MDVEEEADYVRQGTEEESYSLQTDDTQLEEEDGGSWEDEGAEGAEAGGIAAVDVGLSREEVLGRIEEFVAGYIKEVAEGKLPVLQFVSRARANRTYQQVATEDGVGGARSERSNQSNVVALGNRIHSRSLVANQGAGAVAYARVFIVLQAVHELLRSGRSTSQRDLYYKLLQPGVISTPAAVDAALQDLVALLRVPRSSLGIVCASRGSVAGSLYVRETPTSPWVDCSACGAGGKGIPGDVTALAGISFQCSARYLLVVEKDAVFQRLAQDRIWDSVPLVLVTAKGMPDLATRAFCSHLLACFPALTVLGLVDYNPSGVVILSTYKFGSHRMGLESGEYALPGLRWLGLRGSWLVDVEEAFMQHLSKRDRSLLPGLRHSLRKAGGASSTAAAPGAAADGSQQQGRRQGMEQVRSQQQGAAGGQRAGGGAKDSWRNDENQDPSHEMFQGLESEGEQEGSQSQGSEEEEDEEGASDPGVFGPWLDELEVMEQTGYKADIESLYSLLGYAGLKDMLVMAILRGGVNAVVTDPEQLTSNPERMQVVSMGLREASGGVLYQDDCPLPAVPRANFSVVDVYLGVNMMSTIVSPGCYTIFATELAVCIQDLALVQGCCSKTCRDGFDVVLKPECVVEAWDYICSGAANATFAAAVASTLERCLPSVEVSTGLSGVHITCPLTPKLKELYFKHLPGSSTSSTGTLDNRTALSYTVESNSTQLGAAANGSSAGQNGSSIMPPPAAGPCSIQQERWPSYNHVQVATRSLTVFMQLPKACLPYVSTITGLCTSELPWKAGCCSATCSNAMHSIPASCMSTAQRLFCTDASVATYALRVTERCLGGGPYDCAKLLPQNTSHPSSAQIPSLSSISSPSSVTPAQIPSGSSSTTQQELKPVVVDQPLGGGPAAKPCVKLLFAGNVRGSVLCTLMLGLTLPTFVALAVVLLVL